MRDLLQALKIQIERLKRLQELDFNRSVFGQSEDDYMAAAAAINQEADDQLAALQDPVSSIKADITPQEAPGAEMRHPTYRTPEQLQADLQALWGEEGASMESPVGAKRRGLLDSFTVLNAALGGITYCPGHLYQEGALWRCDRCDTLHDVGNSGATCMQAIDQDNLRYLVLEAVGRKHGVPIAVHEQGTLQGRVEYGERFSHAIVDMWEAGQSLAASEMTAAYFATDGRTAPTLPCTSCVSENPYEGCVTCGGDGYVCRWP